MQVTATKSPVARHLATKKPAMSTGYSLFSIDFIVLLTAVLIASNATSMLLYNDGGEREYTAGSALIMAKASGDVSSAVRQLLLAPGYLYAMYYLVRNWQKALDLFKGVLPLTLISLLAIVSTLWSIEPSSTLRRAASLIGGTAFAFYLAARYPLPQFMRILGITLLITCILTFIGVAILPEGIHHDKHFPAWRGFFGHKNQLGNTMDCVLLVGLVLAVSKQAVKLGWTLVIMSAILIAMSLSRSAWMFGIFTVASVGFVILARRNLPLAGVLFAAAALFVFTFLLLGDPVGTYDHYMVELGKDPTMSGRTVVWEHILHMVRGMRMWIGYGYDVFWSSNKGALGENWGLGTFVPAHAHNGWLQIYLHFGIVGVVLLTAGFLIGLWQNGRLVLKQDSLIFAAGIIYIFLYLMINMTECTLMWRDHFQWMMFVYFCITSYQYNVQINANEVAVTASRRQALRSRGAVARPQPVATRPDPAA